MPNTLTSIFVSSPATEPVEAPHPNTGVYVTGTQATAGGPWTVVHTLVTKTATPLTMVGRLKNFPAVTVSVVASGGPFAGNIFNNVLTAPTGMAATGTSSTAINVVVSSIANQGGYRLFAADTLGGTYAQIYQGATASFAHTGLSIGASKFYKWQYVGNGGFYDDSALSSPPFAGLAVNWLNADIASIPPAQSNGSGFSDTAEVAFTNAAAAFPNGRVGIWNKAAGVVQVYRPLTNDQGIPAGTVAGYNRGFGADLGFAIAWLADTANAGRNLVFFKTDMTPPLSTNGSSIAVWNSTLKAPDYADHAKFVTYMQGNGWGNGVSNFSFPDLGEQDSADNNTLYQSQFAALIADFQANGYFDANTKYTIPLLLRVPASYPNDAMINNAKSAFASAKGNAQTMTITSPVFKADGTHYNADSQLRRGQQWYVQRQAVAVPAGTYPINAGTAAYAGLVFANNIGLIQSGADWTAAGTGGFGTNIGLANASLPANTAGRIKLNYASAAGRGAALGLHTSAVKVNIFTMAYGIVIPTDPNLGNYYVSIYQAGTNPAPSPPPTATLTRQYAIARDAANIVTIQESANGNDWRIIFQFTNAFSGPLYPVADVVGSAFLQVPQGTGLTTGSGAGTVSTVYAAGETTFADTYQAATNARWVSTSQGTGTPTYGSSGLTLQPGINSPTPETNRAQLTSAATYSLVGRSLVLNVGSLPNAADASAPPLFFSVGTTRSSASSIGIAVQGNTLYVEVCDGSYYLTAPYSAASMKYLRLRVSADGLTWYGDYSADNVTYFNVVTRALASGVSMAAASIVLSAFQSSTTVVQPGAILTALVLA